jgi:hypothetical protein
MRNKRRDEAFEQATNRQRDEALNRIGEKLFGEYWIAGQEAHDELGMIERLPDDPKRAARTARAQHRNRAYDWQIGVVIRWLHQRDVDCTVSGFDSAKFEIFFSENFGLPLDGTRARKAAVAKRLKAGARPGRGGTTTWKIFRREICADTNGNWDEKTIRRDVRKMRPRPAQ